MTRQYPEVPHIGQKVLVRPNPTSHPIEALVTHLDTLKGMVHVKLLGYTGKWAARPRAVCNFGGQHLHFKNNHFFFDPQPFLS